MSRKELFCLTAFLVLGGCSGLVIDPSMASTDAGDFTLATSACEATPGGGMDICRVREKTAIDSSWKLIVPFGDKEILGGEADVYYRDIHKTYAVTGKIIEIPWKEFFGANVWSTEMDGEAMALVLIRWKDAQGIEGVVKLRGLAKVVVTKEGYDRLPIDSGFGTWGTTCKILYSTAGRGALSCK